MKKSLSLIAVVALLVVVSVFVFAACMPSNPDKAIEKYENAGYTVAAVDTTKGLGNVGKSIASLFSNTASHITKAFTASNGTWSGSVTYFDDTDVAKDYYKSAKENADENTYVKRDGKAVFIGDKEAYTFKKA